MHEDEGILLKDERDMLNGILDLKEMTVEKIMTHRKNIYSINIDQPEEYFKKSPKVLLAEYLFGKKIQIIF